MNFKTVSHRVAKPEMSWSEVSGLVMNFKTVSPRAAKPEMIGVKFQDRP